MKCPWAGKHLNDIYALYVFCLASSLTASLQSRLPHHEICDFRPIDAIWYEHANSCDSENIHWPHMGRIHSYCPANQGESVTSY